MTTRVIWKGIEYNSLEFAEIVEDKKGISATSTIIGSYKKWKYRIDYVVRTDQRWNTRYVEIKTFINKTDSKLSFEIDENKNWTINGKLQKEFAGCSDIDISLTPFTNTLPINRLALKNNEKKVIDVVLVDLLENRITRAKQQYIKYSDLSYKFENVPNDFEAMLKLHSTGLVMEYPGLFRTL